MQCNTLLMEVCLFFHSGKCLASFTLMAVFCCTIHDICELQVHFTSGGVKLLALALLKKHINSHSLHEPEGIAVF
jgi:hypothetical protein